MTHETLLEVRSLERHFAGVQAVRGVDLDVERAEIVGLIGPNGAGKTTVFNMISGLLRPHGGEIKFGGRRLHGMAAHQIAQLGAARTFQNCRIFPSFTTLETVTAVAGWRRRSWLGPLLRARDPDVVSEAVSLLESVGLEGMAATRAGSLTYGQQRRLEIARALALHPTLLLLDEPCAGLAEGEAEEIVSLVRGLSDQGIAVLIIEHNMGVVMRLAGRVVVLDHGEKIAEGTPAIVASDPNVIEAYLGSA